MYQRLLIIFALILPLSAQGFDDPTFIVEGERFNAPQLNDYALGSFDKKLSDDELIQKLKDKKYQKTEIFEMHAEKYFYFAYLVRNRTGQSKQVFVRWPAKLHETMGYIYQNEILQPMQNYPGGDTYYGMVPPGDTVIVAYRRSDSNMSGRIGNVKLQDFTTATERIQEQKQVHAAVQGIVVIMILYNLGLFCFFRKAYFIYYIIYITAAIITLSYVSAEITMSARGMGFWSLVAAGGLILFCRNSLSLQKYHPKINLSLYITFAIHCAFFIYAYYTITVTYNIFATIFTLLMCTLASIMRAMDRYSPAYFFVIGWGTLFIGTLLSFYTMVTATLSYLSYGAIAGFSLEVCFFSFALGERVRLTEQKISAENNHAFEQLKKVFYPHQIQQIKKGQELEATMPTGKSKACVLCFDIIDSSNIQLEEKDRFLESALKQCASIMEDGYDASTMTARAYRIKEMGDGFLCSIGFPFNHTESENVFDAAVLLATDFISVFQNHIDKNGDGEKIFCSIGIAYGPIEGHYPATGAVEYDVYGPAVVAANRYESVRKDLFSDIHNSHLITIQNLVFQNLSENIKNLFQRVDLVDRNYKVRGDKNAQSLFVHFATPEAEDVKLIS